MDRPLMRYVLAVLALLVAVPLSAQQALALTDSPEVACEKKRDALKLARLLSDTARVAQNRYYQHAREWVLEGRCVQLQNLDRCERDGIPPTECDPLKIPEPAGDG